MVLEKLRQSELAIDDLDLAIAAHPNPAPEWFLDRARLELAGGPESRERALAGLDQGIDRLGPVPALSALALELELDLGRHEAALARLDRIEPAGAGRAHWLVRRGDVLNHAGRATEAWVAWSEALELLGDLPPGRRDSPATQALASRLRLALAKAGQP
jgi:tetratricopeptide (TPR) repeat protein